MVQQPNSQESAYKYSTGPGIGIANFKALTWSLGVLTYVSPTPWPRAATLPGGHILVYFLFEQLKLKNKPSSMY